MKKNSDPRFLVIPWIALVFGITPHTSLAGKDPVGWQIESGTGIPAQTIVGNSYHIHYLLTNNLPFPLPFKGVSLTHTGSSYNMHTNCNNVTLQAKGQPGSSCEVGISFRPGHTGPHAAFITMKYGYNRVPLPTLFTNTISGKTTEGIEGVVTKPLPPQSTLGGSYPVEFTFTNDGSASVTASSVLVSGFTATTNTCTAPLNVNASCIVSGTFVPATPGPVTLGVTYQYSGKSVALITQSKVSGECIIDANTELLLPANVYTYSDNIVKFNFHNPCTAPANLQTVELNSTFNSVTRGSDTCSGATLAPNATCSVFASVVPQQVGNLQVQASVAYGTTQQAVTGTSTFVNTVNASHHHIIFVNQCPFPVWYGISNGTGDASPDPTPPDQRSSDDYRLAAQLAGHAPATKELITIAPNAYVNGAIWGRTDCVKEPQGLTCETGSCATGNGEVGTCVPVPQPTAQPSPPYTKLEFFMSPSPGSDAVYDISQVNGASMPVEIKGLGPTSNSDPFHTCAAVGGLIQPAGSPLGACPWSYNPASTGDPVPNYIFVTSGPLFNCNSDADCVPGQFCGTAFTSVSPTTGGNSPWTRRCGFFQGYWSVLQIASGGPLIWTGPNLWNYYNLGDLMVNGPSGPYGKKVTYGAGTMCTIGSEDANIAQLYLCPGNSYCAGTGCANGSPPVCIGTPFSLNSGYATANTYNVCGCHNWNTATDGLPYITAQASDCQGRNQDWIDIVLKRIAWLKQACPTAYSYSTDDQSSSFTCNPSPAGFTSYQITYCPGGKTGRPGT